ncbi:MAG: DNA polymerase I [Firmicutes bacterium]|nr:DNA polymerase I [Bacillota bacterium]
MQEKIVIVDGHSLAHRAFFALPPLTTSRGEPTNAIYGVATMTLRLLEEEAPDYFFVAIDVGRTFRHDAYDGYKKTRRPPDPDFLAQLPGVKEFFNVLGAPVAGVEGYEADDVIGAMSAVARQAGLEVVVVSGDRDLFQLLDEGITILYTRKGISEVERVTVDWVREKYGLAPAQLIDLKALTGDQSDNVPGIPGIGEKTALRLLQEFGGLENLLARVEEVKSPRQRELLATHAEQARLSKKLVTIVRDLPLPVSLQECRRPEMDPEALAGFFRRMEFRSLLKRMAAKAATAKTGETVEAGVVSAGAMPAETDKDAAVGAGAVISRLAVPEFQRLTPEELPEFLDGAGEEPVAVQFLAAATGREGDRAPVALGVALAAGGGDSRRYAFLPLGPGDFPGPLKEWLAGAETPKIAHNAKSQMTLAWHYGAVWEGLVFDTEIAAYLLNGGRGEPDLEGLYADLIDGPELPVLIDKKGKDLDLLALPAEFTAESGEAAAVAVTRAMALKELEPVCRERLRQDNMEKLFFEVEMPLLPVLFRMERKGIRICPQRLKGYGEKLAEKIGLLEKKIYTLAGEEFNISSPKQLGVILFERLQLPKGRKTKTGYSTDAEVLEELAVRHPVPRLVLEYRGLVKLKNTYVEALLALADPETGRVHTTFHQTLTATGRLSSADPNLQNIPVRTEEGREIRCSFLPGAEGEVFVSADYSQIELRILAHLAGDERLAAIFHEGGDIHSRTAAEIFGLAPEEVTPVWRDRAKAVNFGIIYGISPFGLARQTGVSQREAEEYITGYFQRYQGVKAFFDNLLEEAREKGYVTTLFQRRRYLPELRSKNFQRRSFAERMARNTPIQGSAADLIKVAMVRVDERLRREKIPAALLLQVHDELLVETKREYQEAVAAVLREEMESVYPLSVPLLVEVSAGPNWGEMAPVHRG